MRSGGSSGVNREHQQDHLEQEVRDGGNLALLYHKADRLSLWEKCAFLLKTNAWISCLRLLGEKIPNRSFLNCTFAKGVRPSHQGVSRITKIESRKSSVP